MINIGDTNMIIIGDTNMIKLLCTLALILLILSGCGQKEEMLAYRSISVATIKAQGELDKKWIQSKRSEEKKITDHPSQPPVPMITTTTAKEEDPVYTDALGESQAAEQETTTDTRVDHTAYAIQQLGAVALALAERSGGVTRGGDGKMNTIPRIIYKMPEMPKNGPADIIRAVGDALHVSGAIPALVQGWLGWMAADTISEVAQTQRHTGDYVQLQGSLNPTTNTTYVPLVE